MDSQGKEQPLVEMTRDGFTLLTMGFTGEKAVHWKIAYINAFNLMEAKLNHQVALIRELLLSNRKWRKILRYRQLRLSQREIGKLLDLKPRTIYHHFVRLRACGLLDSSPIAMPTSLSLQVMLQFKQ